MSIPKLYDDEGDRIVALCVAGALLLLVPFAGHLPSTPEPAPSRWCAVEPCRASSPLAGLVLGTPMDLNRVDAESLEALDGIGPSLAAGIVADRAKNGPFYSVEDVDRVKGIGPARIKSMRPYVTVRP